LRTILDLSFRHFSHFDRLLHFSKKPVLLMHRELILTNTISDPGRNRKSTSIKWENGRKNRKRRIQKRTGEEGKTGGKGGQNRIRQTLRRKNVDKNNRASRLRKNNPENQNHRSHHLPTNHHPIRKWTKLPYNKHREPATAEETR